MHTAAKADTMLIDGRLVAEASQIGLPPGNWPDFIAVLDEANNGFLFQLERVDDSLAVYSTRGGAVMHVLND